MKSNVKSVKLSFSLKLKEEPVEIDGTQFILRELTGAQRDTYLSLQAGRAERHPETGKIIGVKNFDGINTKLVSMSLRGPDGKSVPEATIKDWPSTVVEALFEAAQELSGLDRPEEEGEAAEAAKNGSGASPSDTSGTS